MLLLDCLKLYCYLSKMRILDLSNFNTYKELLACIELKLIQIKLQELKKQSNSIKNKISLELENIQGGNYIKKGDYSWMFTKIKSIDELEEEMKEREIEIEELNFKEIRNTIHPYSLQLLKKKPSIAKIQQTRKINEYYDKIGNRDQGELQKLRDKLEKYFSMKLIEHSNSKRNFLLGGLKRRDAAIYQSTMAKITNFLVLIRSSLIYITLIACPNEPIIQIGVLLLQEIGGVILMVRIQSKNKHLSHCTHIFTFMIRSLLFTLFMGICFYLSIYRRSKTVYLPVQIAGSIILTLMIIFELILAFCGFFYSIREIYNLSKQLYEDFKRQRLIKSRVNLVHRKNKLNNERKEILLSIQNQKEAVKQVKIPTKIKLNRISPDLNRVRKMKFGIRKARLNQNKMIGIKFGKNKPRVDRA